MRRWLTWRARLEHLLFPEFECMCVVCEATRDENTRLKLELRQAQQRALIPHNPVPLAQGGPVMGPPHTAVQIGPPFVWRAPEPAHRLARSHTSPAPAYGCYGSADGPHGGCIYHRPSSVQPDQGSASVTGPAPQTTQPGPDSNTNALKRVSGCPATRD